MIHYLGEVDDVGLWFAAVVAGLTALGWVMVRLRRAWKAGRVWLQKAKAVLDLAELELKPNGGATIKDATTRVPLLEKKLGEVKDSLDAHLELSLKGRGEVAARLTDVEMAVAYLADGLPSRRPRSAGETTRGKAS